MSKKGPTQSPESEVEKCGDCQPDLEAEAWSERTAVITKYDHEQHCQLARSFVNDIADKVVTDCEYLKSGSLPDLVPSPSDKSRSDEFQTDDSEYESADELPLQDTIYLDSTISGITPSRSTVEESILRLDATVVLDSSKEQPQHIDTEEDQHFLCEEVDGTISQADQHRSPVHDKTLSDAVESAAGDSASDALSPDTVPGDLDVDFILQFEKLALNNQKAGCINHDQDCASDISPIADLQTDAYEPVQESVLKEVEPTPNSVPSVDEIVQESTQTVDNSVQNTSDSISEVINTTSVNQTIQELTVDNSTENTSDFFPADNTVITGDSKEVPVDLIPVGEALVTIHVQDDETPLVPTPPSDLNSEQNSQTESKEEELVVSTENNLAVINEVVSEEKEVPIVPKKGYDLSFLDKFEDLENASPSIVSGKSKSIVEQVNVEEDQLEENLICEDRLDDAITFDINASEEKQDSNALAQKDREEISSPELCIQLSAVEETAPTTEDHTGDDNNIPDISATDEEAVIVPKKGYDLSFLDRLDDLENASPSAITNSSKLKETSSKTEMKETVTTDTTSIRPTKNSDSQEADQENQETKKPTKRIPIRSRVAKNTSAPKKDPFEVEFTFDSNEDPFKPKAKLASSPPKDRYTPTSEENSASAETMANDSSDTTLVINGNGTDSSLSNTTQEPSLDNRLSFGSQATRKNDIGEEEFRPATEVFQNPSDLDFLLQHGGNSKDIALARQSLYVKFDPLVGGRPSLFPNKTETTVNEETIIVHDEEEENGTKGDSLFFFSPPHPSSSNGRSEGSEKKNQPIQHPSALFVAGDVIGLNEHKEVLKVQELLFQDRLLQKEREIQAKETDCQELKSKLESTLEAQTQMRQIVGEYEKTISQLIAEKEREKASLETALQTTAKEKEQAIEDLKEVERAFSEFHKMYERNRAAAEGLHKNEEALKKALAAYQERLQQEQHKYETLKLHAAQKLEGAQQEMENMKKTLEAENARIKAVLKKTEMRLASVETSLEQKTKENEELTKLCDELINKLGSSGSQ